MRQSVEGTVVAVTGAAFHVHSGEGILACTPRGRLRRGSPRASSPAVVGDRVQVTPQPDGSGVIEEVLPRRNKFSRPGFRGLEHVVAANIDLLVVVVSMGAPPFKRNIVDRFVIHARQGGIAPLLVVNKCDLVGDAEVRHHLAPFEASAIPWIAASARTGRGLEEIRALLGGHFSVLVGQSGVGKSSLLTALFGDLQIETQEVSVHGKGKHTTTTSRAYDLPGGGRLVDTPGIKSLGISEATAAGLDETFPEIEELASGCRFRNCRHLVEPACAVLSALERGEIEEGRYRSYARLRRGQ